MAGSRNGVQHRWRHMKATTSPYAHKHESHYHFSMAPKTSKKAMMATDTTYGMSMDLPESKKGKSRRHRRGNSNHSEDAADPSDGSASLTYSAGSSIASSAAGESTDSSFADIMRVLDVQDSNELAAYMKREGVTDPAQAYGRKTKSSMVSVTSSLNYSTDGESALEGARLLETITGQPSDSNGPDGGGFGDFGGDIAFAAADEPVKRKGRKDRSSRGDRNRSSPKGSRSSQHKRSKSSSSRGSKGEQRSSPSTPPPPVPRSKSMNSAEGGGEEDEDEVWYAKWWMCGFADSFRDLVPKR